MKNKLPKGFKVTVYQPEPGWYDRKVWKDGLIILGTSMTMFEFKDKAREVGIRRAWDIFEGKKEWS